MTSPDWKLLVIRANAEEAKILDDNIYVIPNHCCPATQNLVQGRNISTIILVGLTFEEIDPQILEFLHYSTLNYRLRIANTLDISRSVQVRDMVVEMNAKFDDRFAAAAEDTSVPIKSYLSRSGSDDIFFGKNRGTSASIIVTDPADIEALRNAPEGAPIVSMGAKLAPMKRGETLSFFHIDDIAFIKQDGKDA